MKSIVYLLIAIIMIEAVAIAFLSTKISPQNTLKAPSNGLTSVTNSTSILVSSSVGSSTVISTQPSSTTILSNSSLGLFNSSKYVSYAYLLYPNRSTSAAAGVAMSDFNTSVQKFANGSASVTINFTDTHASYTVMVQPGFRLYFLDKNLGDDSIVRDSTSGDDGYVLVNSNWDITYVNYPLPNA